MVKFPSHLNNREHSSQAPRHKSGFQMFTESLLGQAPHEMPYVAQLTMTNLTGDSKKFTESTALFPSFNESKEKVELGLRGLIFRKKKKRKQCLDYILHEGAASCLCCQLLVPCDLRGEKEILVNE